jgi:hypothetical protein
MDTDYKAKIREGVFDDEKFVRLTLKGVAPSAGVPWRRIVVRPVMLKGGRHLQFSYYDERRDITKNYRREEAEEKLNEALVIPFASLHLLTTAEDTLVQVTPKGKAIVHRKDPPPEASAPDLSHDRSKALPLPPDRPDRFLQTLGIMNSQGAVVPRMAGKLQQINEFLKLMEHTGELERIETRPVNILDCGSGSSYLSFAVYHYLNNVLKIPARLVGIDTNQGLVDKSNANVEEMGFGDMCFETSAISNYKPEVPPDIVLALHACDTATDDALALGVRYGARLILSVPCCHHDLHTQLEAKEPFEPVMREGILKKRLGDILTDTFRALALRAIGYRTDVVEFVSTEHTDRNLMIRAAKREDRGDANARRDYDALKEFWAVTPYIEKALGELWA